MKIRLMRFFIRLALTAVMTSGFTASVAAHDLPLNDYCRQAFATNCIDSDSNRRESVVAISEPTKKPHQDAQPAPQKATITLTSSLTSISIYVDTAFNLWRDARDLQQQFELLGKLTRNIRLADLGADETKLAVQIKVNTPAVGIPPSPGLASNQARSVVDSHRVDSDALLPVPWDLANALDHFTERVRGPLAGRSLAKHQYFNGYTPYNFPLGELTLKRSIQTQLEQFHDATAARATVNSAIAWLEQAECQLAVHLDSLQAAKSSGHSMARWLAFASRTTSSALGATLSGYDFDVAPAEPYYSSPAFVIYESVDGKQFVLTVEDARRWNLVRDVNQYLPRENEIKRQCPVASLLRQQLDRFVIQKLESWIPQSDFLAAWLTQVAEERLADVSTRSLR